VDLPPYGARSISVRARVEIAERPRLTSLPDATPFLGAEPLLEIDAPPLQAAARNFEPALGQVELARAIHAAVHARLRSSSYAREDRGALWAIEHGEGDCTEFARLVVALARARSIPARVVGGFVVVRDTVLDPGVYHNWAELHVDGAWRISDAQNGVFDDTSGSYLAIRTHGADPESPLTGDRRLAAAAPVTTTFE
jgi:transglutaminase-like putative cysteine protease